MAGDKPGPKPRYTDEELVKLLDDYIETTDIPIVAEFAFLAGYNRTSVYEIPAIADGLRKLTTKKEFALERSGYETTNMAHQRMVETALKQIGWSEKTDVNLSGGVQLTRILDDVPKEPKA